MKRTWIVLMVLTAALVCASAASGASFDGRLAPLRAHELRPHTLLPLAGPAGSTTTYTIGGTVEDFAGNPQAGYEVDWGWFDPDGDSWSPAAATYHDGAVASTADDGTFAFPGATSDPGHDSLSVFAFVGGWYDLDRWGLDFSTTQSYVMRPGHAAVTVAHALATRPITVELGDAAGSFAESDVDLTGSSHVADTAAPDFNSGVACYPQADGAVTAECEWSHAGHATVAVTPGTLAGTTVAFDWSQAVHGHLLGPLCQHAGRPGSIVRFGISNLPAGEQLSFFGTSWSPADWGLESYPTTVTSTGTGKAYTVLLRVPQRATVGEEYMIEAVRTDDPQSLLTLYDDYAVCTYGASRNVIDRGGVVRLRGKTGLEGNGAVTLLERHSRAGEPSSVKAPGWTRVATLSTADGGTFHSSLLRPSRTTWYVARFWNGDFTAFTPVVKVTVR